MSIKKTSQTGKGCGCEESHSMPGTSKAMEIGNEQAETDPAMQMPGGGMSSGRSDESSGGMPKGGMSSAKGDEAISSMLPGSDKGDEVSVGMPGGGGMSGDGNDGGGDGGETPRSRSCATMEVHRQLLSRFPSYAQARDEIENLALHYAINPEAAQRPGVTRIPIVVHVVWNTTQQNILRCANQ